MKVGNTGIDQVGIRGSDGVSGSSTDLNTESSAGGKTGAKSDSVSLSSAANLVALAKASASSRDEKVQSIGSQIRSGTYQSDPEQVSQAVVQGHIR